MLRRRLISALGLSAAMLGEPVGTRRGPGGRRIHQAAVRRGGGTIKADKAIQSGDVARIRALVDSKVMPHVNFERMTAMSVGPQWRSASPDQRKRMLDEFKLLLVNTYSGAMTQVKDQTIAVKPLRSAPVK